MKFDIWYDFRNPIQWRQPWSQLYEETLEQITWADKLGFDCVWLSEHHFTAEGYLPAIFPMLAALAMRTEQMHLGTAILLTPLYHPLRLAEEAAVVDVISNGRLELGLAPGYRPKEFEVMGVPKKERGRRTNEAIELLKLAWAGETFSYQGEFFRFDDVVVAPQPVQQPHPRLWIGGSSPAAANRAGRYGCHFMPDSGAPAEVYDIYRQVLQTNGYNPADFAEIATNRVIYVCEDPDEGWNDVKEHYLYVFNMYREWFAEAGDHADWGEPLRDADQLSRELHLVGTPEMVIAAIEERRQQFPFERLIFWARPPGLSIDKSNRSLELFADDVIPHFSEEAVES